MKKRTEPESEIRAVRNDSLNCELLSPAGDADCLYAAAAAGADAVYAASDRFGARAYASNFTEDEFIHAIDYMHMLGKKLYLTLNTLIKEREFESVYAFIKPFYAEGLDGVIVQDMGIVRYLLREFPGLPVHASTQMSVTSAYGAGYLQKTGVARVVTARELSISEIREIHQKCDIEIESFIHGAMCCAYSGQCLMSSMLGGRSGNRGRCAGPCRQPYSAGNINQKYILSLKDMCTVDILPDLIEAGVCSLKIEGRMKAPAYVSGVTGIYRKYLDIYKRNGREGYSVEQSDRDALTRLYSRGGISTGYYGRRNGSSMVTVVKPGYISSYEEKDVPGRIRLKISGRCRAVCGEPLELAVSSGDINTVVTKDIVDTASKHPVTEADIVKQLRKTGDTDMEFDELVIETDGRAFIPVAALNALRRDAVRSLYERLISGYKRSLRK